MPSAPPLDAVSPPQAPASAFRKVGAIDGEPVAFARDAGSVFLAMGIDVVAVLEGDGVSVKPELNQADDFALRPMSQLVTVTKGNGPSVLAAWIFPEGRMGATEVERFDGKKWSKGTRTRNAHVINQIYNLGGGRIVAIEEPQMAPYGMASIIAIEGPKTGLPRISKRPGKPVSGAPIASGAWFVPVAIWAGKDGGFHVIGNPYPAKDDANTQPMFESFDAKGKSTGQGDLTFGVTDKTVSLGVTAIPVPGGPVVVSLVAGEGAQKTTLHIARAGAEKPDFVHIQGLTGEPQSFAADAKGDLWIITTGATISLFHVTADGKAAPIVIPAELGGASGTPPTVMAKSADDVWLLSPKDGKLEIYRTKKDAPAIDVALVNPQDAIWARLEQKAQQKAEKDAAKQPLVFAQAFGPQCQTPFVLLYTLAKTAPADYDFPSTRDALKGHTELSSAKFLEFSRGGKRFFGAAVPSGDVGKKLVEAVKGKVAGSSPQLVCDAPTAERTIAIDLATGKIKP